MNSTRVNEILTVTEQAAFAAGAWIGKGDKMKADEAATEAMRAELGKLPISGRVVIGEGERDEAPMLYIGEELGLGGEEIDIAVDPLEGTNMCAYAQPNSICVMAIAPRGALLYAPDTYMWKVAAGPAAKDAIAMDGSPEQNGHNVADALGKPVSELTVCLLDRERNAETIAGVRAAGARVRLIGDGDVFGVLQTAVEGSGIDLYLGSGAAPEGVLAATAMRCIGGGFEGRFFFRNDSERTRALKTSGVDIDAPLTLDMLVRSDEAAFIATGVTDGELLKGVRGRSRAYSLIMDCQSKSVRFIESVYRHAGEGQFEF